MRNKNVYVLSMLGLLALTSLGSCNKLLDVPNIDQDSIKFKLRENLDCVLPLAKAEANISEVLFGHEVGDGYLVSEEDKLIIRYTEDNIIDYSFSDFFDKGVPSYNNKVKYPKEGFPYSQTVSEKQLPDLLPDLFPVQQEHIDLELPEEVTVVNKFKFSGRLSFQTSNMPINLKLHISFSEVVGSDGKPFFFEVDCAKGENSKVVQLKDLTYVGENLGNKLRLSYKIERTLLDNEESVTFQKGKYVKLQLKTENIMVYFFEGKTKPYVKEVEGLVSKPDFSFFDKTSGLRLYNSKISLNLKGQSLIGAIQFRPSFLIKQENQEQTQVNLEEQEAEFAKLEKESLATFNYQGDKVEKLLDAFLNKNIDTRGEIVVNPEGKRLAFTQDTKLKGSIAFEQELDFKMDDYSFDLTTSKVDAVSELEYYLNNCSLLVHSESNIPLEISFDSIEVLDKEKQEVNYTIPMDGVLRGARNKTSKSKVLVKLLAKDIKKFIELNEFYLRFRGHLSSIDKERVQLDGRQQLKIKVVLGVNHKF